MYQVCALIAAAKNVTVIEFANQEVKYMVIMSMLPQPFKKEINMK